VDCFRQLIAKEGVRGLYRGIVPNLIGITPEKAIKLAVNDFAREYWANKTNVSEEHLAIQDVPFSIMFFPLNSFLKLQGADENGKIPFSTIFGAGIVSGVVAASAVTPADVIKTRLQVARKPGDPVYRGIVDCFQQIVKNEGVAALFKGVVPRSLIVAPMFAIALFVYELQQRFLVPAVEIGSSHSATKSNILMLSEKN
ncbi:hypothetical protein BGZ94_008686, partial [Podila epigama]